MTAYTGLWEEGDIASDQAEWGFDIEVKTKS